MSKTFVFCCRDQLAPAQALMFDLLLNASCFPSLPSQTVSVLVGTVSHVSAVFPVVKLPSVLGYVRSQFVRAHLETAEPISSAHSRQALPLVPIPAPLPIANGIPFLCLIKTAAPTC